MKLILVRHGETEWNHLHRMQGLTDLPLTETGRAQAEAIATALKNEAVEVIYSSPLKRALETARIINRFHQVEIIPVEELKELNVGQLEGLYAEEMKARYSDFFQAWTTDPASTRMPGGESLPEVQERVWSAVTQIRQQNHLHPVILVSHFFSLIALFCKLLDLRLSDFRKLYLGVGSISRVEFNEDKAKLLSFNDTCHLEIGKS